jgi:hypothetical protein
MLAGRELGLCWLENPVVLTAMEPYCVGWNRILLSWLDENHLVLAGREPVVLLEEKKPVVLYLAR